jgi:hypothetical protein
VAERDSAVHAAGALALELRIGLKREVLLIVAHALAWVALVKTDSVDVQKRAELAHRYASTGVSPTPALAAAAACSASTRL